jgi:formate/nitrite transporter FocA (FNT family)
MPKNLGPLLLAAFLIVFGVSNFVAIGFLHYVVGVLAIAAGALMLMNKPA